MAQSKAHNVTVYSTTTCPYCEMAKDFLNKSGVKFRDVNVSDDERAAQEMIAKSGQMGVPVLDIDGHIIVGFDKSEIAKVLGL